VPIEVGIWQIDGAPQRVYFSSIENEGKLEDVLNSNISILSADLRHTCATLLLKMGVHPKVVQELLGHATVSITLDTYSHVLPGMDGDAAAGMEDLFP
jgi:integrase